jgi:ADP-ribosyl-[dinitrogen reductase] hydrolase
MDGVSTAIRERIHSGLMTYAAGDAAGVPWEGCTSHIDLEAIDTVPHRSGWPPGATSDDTALTLLVADYLAERGAVVDEHDFLIRLAAAVPEIRGIGPSTHAAVARFTVDGTLHANSGDTNGAAMRALPLGWAIPHDELRRRLVIGLSRTTHGAPQAIGAACVVAAMASSAVEGAPLGSLVDVAVSEIDWVHEQFARQRTLLEPALNAIAGRWQPEPEGVTLDAAQTLAAVVDVVRRTADRSLTTGDALRYAISLRGDTDTVAAISGGIIGCRDRADDADIPWLERVDMPSQERLDAVSVALSTLRASLSG